MDPEHKRLQEGVTEAEEQLTGRQVEAVLAAVCDSAAAREARPDERLFRVDISLSFPKAGPPSDSCPLYVHPLHHN